MTVRSLFAALALSVLPALAETNVLGTVVDAGSDAPLPKARVFGPDSSFLGSSDAQGRFELRLPRPFEVRFQREGYRDTVIALADLGNLFDLQVEMEPTGVVLDTGDVVGVVARRRQAVGEIAALQEVTGMRFDLQEMLRVLPGVSGTREFSSEVSVYGSRSADVTHVLGPFPIPNLRHLDYSFPGNQSVLNPRMLQSITVEHDPTRGPLEQGLASALRYTPARPATDHHELVASLGLTDRSVDVKGPVGNGTYAATGRWLDPALLSHLADRFFAGSGETGGKVDQDKAPASKFDLQAFDGYARVEQGVGDFALAVTTLGSFDDHTAKLKVYSNGDEDKYVPVSRGTKGDWLAFAESQGDLAGQFLQFYAGAVGSSEAVQLSDTTGYLLAQLTEGTSDPYAAHWAAYTRDQLDLRAGGVLQPSFRVLGGDAELLASVHTLSDKRGQGRYFQGDDLEQALQETRPYMKNRPYQDELTWLRSRSSARVRWRADSVEWAVAAGGLWVQDAGWESEATASLRAPFAGFGWTANLSRRAQEQVRAVEPGEMGVHMGTAWEAKAGVGRRLGPIEVTSAVYGRYYEDPALPEAPMWWGFPVENEAKQASVLGGTLQAAWNTWHHLQIQTNLSRVQGQYELEDGSNLEWEADRDLDVWTSIKIHPRADTLFSILLSHQASLGKPYYAFELDTAARTLRVVGDDQVEEHPSWRDAFRTDVRIQMDLPSRLPPFRMVRFYAELQNLFAEFDGDWARWLGGSNVRARSWTPTRVDGKGSVIEAVPLFAEGTGLFVSFGVEASLGI